MGSSVDFIEETRLGLHTEKIEFYLRLNFVSSATLDFNDNWQLSVDTKLENNGSKG